MKSQLQDAFLSTAKIRQTVLRFHRISLTNMLQSLETEIYHALFVLVSPRHGDYYEIDGYCRINHPCSRISSDRLEHQSPYFLPVTANDTKCVVIFL